MKSVLILVVEHGETTDPITDMLDNGIDGMEIIDYSVSVDVPTFYQEV